MLELRKKYNLVSKIGEGGFSEVWKVEDLTIGGIFAAKILKKSYKSEDEITSCIEIETLKKLDSHPNVIGLHNIIYEPLSGSVAIILELMDMSLYDYIRTKKQYLSEIKAKYFLFQILNGLKHLHSSGIFHRDIKPENILVRTSKNQKYIKEKIEIIQLSDLGSACNLYKDQPHTGYVATRWYRAPEVLLTNGYYSAKMDIWAVGCVFYEILTLLPLFPGTNELDQLNKIHNILGSPSELILSKFKNRVVNYTFPKTNPTDIQSLVPMLTIQGVDILKKTLVYHPLYRINAHRLMNHHYFSNLTRRSYENTRLDYSSTPSLLDCNKTFKNTSIINKGIFFSPSKDIESNSGSRIKSTVNVSYSIKSNENDYNNQNNEHYSAFLKTRERVWGMNSGTAKTALLETIKVSAKERKPLIKY